MTDSTSPESPMHLGSYHLERRVSKGGMGEIWRATDSDGRLVAVKRLLVDRMGELSERHRTRLIREAEIIEQLRHENIVRYMDLGFDGEGQPYLVLEWLDGEDLGHWHRRSHFNIEQILEVARQALRGLAVCHAQGVIHRDIKPGNLFLLSGQEPTTVSVKLVDFGLALLGDDHSRLTRAGQVVGTLSYLAPEQARGERRVDHRVDIYALGVVLYELITGRLPFSSDNPVTVLLKIVSETPPAPRQLRPDLPGWLEQVILRAMQRDADDRFSSAEEMTAALEPRVSESTVTTITPVVAFDPFGETVAPATATTSHEYRLVSLLCAQPTTPDAGDDLASVVSSAVEDVGGVVYRLLGGQIIGIFGLDRTLGDEALRAVRAGIEVCSAAGDRAQVLAATIHLAVGVGLQLDGEELDEATGALDDLPSGALVVDLPTKELGGDQLEVEHHRHPDGEHLVVRRLWEGVTWRRKVLGVETPTVGREIELASVKVAFARVAENEEPEALLVLGQAGIGKSRLVNELLPELRKTSALCLEGRAQSSATRTPYLLLAGALGQAAGIHVGRELDDQRAALRAFIARYVEREEDSAQVAAFVGEAMGVSFDETPALRVARSEPKVMREQVARAFETLLHAAGRSGPVCLCLEDLHWADEDTLLLCQQMLERLDRCPFFLLTTSRPQLLERQPDLFEEVDATRIELQPLKRRPLHKLLRRILKQEPSQEMDEMIATWSDGNPYFVEELVSWMVTAGILVRDRDHDREQGELGWRLRGDPSALELPAGIEGAIQGRLDQLPLELKEMLKAAAVYGEVFWREGCEALGFVDPGQLLRQLEAGQFVSRQASTRIADSSEWMFRHALLRQVAYQMLLPDRRQQLHLQAARWLDQAGETDAALLAHHFELGGAPVQAASHQARAGEKALADGDLDRAVECYEAALDQAGDELAARQRAERLMGLARARILLGQYDAAWQTLDRCSAVEALGKEEPRRAEILFMRGRILFVQGMYTKAAAVLNRAQELISEGDSETRLAFEVRHAVFWVLWVQGKYQEAGPIAEQLYLETLDEGPPERRCSAKLAFAYYNVVEGDLSASVELAQEAVDLARQIGHPYREVDALMLLGSTQELAGLYDQALEALRAADELATRLKISFQQANTQASLGRVHLTTGRNSEALSHFQTAVRIAETLGDDRTLAIALAGQARALCHRSVGRDMSLASQAAERARGLAVDRAPPVEAEARLALAEIGFVQGRREEAAEQALAAVEVLDRLGTQEQCEVEILLVASSSLKAVGQTERARDLLERAWRAFRPRARRISDEAIRASFEQRVPHNRRLRELWESSIEQTGE